MASPFQQQALRRKLVYLILIAVLFTTAGVYRAVVVEAKARDLALLEQNLGEVEVGGAALQLSLTGSRGFVICALWNWAYDAQKKNRWNELELYVDALTRLQPHFITPWRFQSWNLAYNVSVEADQVKDKYFYVARGVTLLEKGERKNHNHPDLRFDMGFFQQNKIMQSDETNVFRCLYQMSCMPPPDRNPDSFWTDNTHKTIDRATFEKFCQDHPQFVRRLHDKLRCTKPEDVVRFLEDNKRIPTIYVDDPQEAGPEWAQNRAPLKPVPERFPALPPPADVRRHEAVNGVLYDENEVSYDTDLKDSFDAYVASRAWYVYAMECLPAPSPEWPGESAPVVDRTRQRNPRMTTNIFRNHPPRAQSYVAERLQQEGWFGPEGWLITGWFPNDQFSDKHPARVGTAVNWSDEAWHKAHDMWVRRGKDSLMLLDRQEELEVGHRAEAYLKPFGLFVGNAPPGPEPPRDSPEHAGWQAAQFMWLYLYAQNLVNYRHFYYRSLVEMQPEMLEARRTLFDAVQAIREGRRDRAAELYESKTGLELLRQVFEKYPEFGHDSLMQDECYEIELRYIKLMQDKEGPTFKQFMEAGNLLGAGLPPVGAPPWPGLVSFGLLDPSLMTNLPVPEFVPALRMRLEAPDKKDDKGTPFIPDTIIYQVKSRHGMVAQKPEMPPGMRPAPLKPPSRPGMSPPSN